ncbi:carboxymuconolactone decarboxylase family protein, partial [Mycobacterium paraense]|uniref:carboxymuconolactone decarboxylase family protein n=1 Tax=Mycobacterium paraense TaxID=767916 RepID=UPI0019D3250D
AQMKREFQLVPPVTLHAPIPELLTGVWGMLRESIVAGSVSRGLREVVCEGVSAINQCSFCVDAHSILLVGAGDTSTANAIRANRPDLIADRKTREVAMWAFANRQPGADILREPPFTAHEAPQLIASAACFHYIDRMVQVFLPDGPVALPSKLRWLRGTTIRVAGTAAGKRIMARAGTARAGAGVRARRGLGRRRAGDQSQLGRTSSHGSRRPRPGRGQTRPASRDRAIPDRRRHHRGLP